MVTTIQLSNDLVEVLKKRKLSDRESYEEIIWDLIEDTRELSDEAKRNIEQSEKEFKEGKVVKLSEIKKRLRMNV